MSEDISQVLSSLHPFERKTLAVFIDKNLTRVDDEMLRKTSGLDEARLSMAAGWLLSKNLLTVAGEEKKEIVSVTEQGRKYFSDGLPVLRVLEKLRKEHEVTIAQLRDLMGPNEVSKTIGELKSADIIVMGPGGKVTMVEVKAASSPLIAQLNNLKDIIADILDKTKIDLKEASESNRGLILAHASGRGKMGIFHIQEIKKRAYRLTDIGQALVSLLPKGVQATSTSNYEALKTIQKEATSNIESLGSEVSQLTQNMLKDGSWRNIRFRRYNIQLKPGRMAAGRKHPYREFLDSVKTKLVSMGFQEMRGPLVESEFWNSDALFMPQFHPARDIHDVYFVNHPKSVTTLPEPQALQVAKTHESGWKTGSRGWRYTFDLKRAQRLVLRSQGTAVSARTLAAAPKIPGKYFSIARCFRYDLVDATHAPDFFQVEGIALGEKITFRTLLGLLKLFAAEMAHATEIKYLPAYFPYTEPSVEMHVRHPQLGWMELGGAGLFRPEVTLPLGVRVPVIAWGLGLDRMAMVALGIGDIRDLFSSDLDLIRTKRARP